MQGSQLNRHLTALMMIAAIPLGAAPAIAQSVEPDPAALQQFSKLVQSYRERPALRVTSEVTVSLQHGQAASEGSKVRCETLFAPGRKGVVKVKGFTCHLQPGETGDGGGGPDAPGSGTLSVTHEGNEDLFFSVPDDGSPYYALLTSFVDLPFPELAIAFGENEPADLLMQFHPKAPWLQPTGVRTEQRDGKERRILDLKADHDQMTLIVDPATNLIEHATLTITGGDMVQEGYTMTYVHDFTYETHKEPLPESNFQFEAGKRQRVDLIAALPPPPQPDERQGVMAGGLVGQIAPPIVLSTADNKAFDLEDERGRVVVLDFWASWCGPCMQGLPKLHEAAAWAKREQMPVTFMTINAYEIQDPTADTADARLASVKKTWEKKSFSLPIAMDYTDQVAGAYGVASIPTTVIVRSDGVIHAMHRGAMDAATLQAEIKDALDAAEAPEDVEEAPAAPDDAEDKGSNRAG